MSAIFTVSVSDTLCPGGWHLPLVLRLRSVVINCPRRSEEGSPRLLFPGVNERRGERGYRGSRGTRVVLQDGLGSPLPRSDISHRAVWSDRLGACAFRTRARLVVLVQLWQPLREFLLMYLHTEQTGNCVHLYANVFVPKAGILN